MFYFLPEEYKKAAVAEYRQRLTIVGLGLALAFMAIGCVLALPTYAVLQTRKESAVMERDAFVHNLKEDPEKLRAEIGSINTKIAMVKDTTSTLPVTAILERLLAQRGNGILITNISVKRGGGTGSLSLSGIASSRDALVSFSKRLQGVPSFKDVNLPVNSLARNKDIPFSISIDSAI